MATRKINVRRGDHLVIDAGGYGIEVFVNPQALGRTGRVSSFSVMSFDDDNDDGYTETSGSIQAGRNTKTVPRKRLFNVRIGTLRNPGRWNR